MFSVIRKGIGLELDLEEPVEEMPPILRDEVHPGIGGGEASQYLV